MELSSESPLGYQAPSLAASQAQAFASFQQLTAQREIAAEILSRVQAPCSVHIQSFHEQWNIIVLIFCRTASSDEFDLLDRGGDCVNRNAQIRNKTITLAVETLDRRSSARKGRRHGG